MEVEVAEWSKALDSGSSPKGRGFKSRPLHFLHTLPNISSRNSCPRLILLVHRLIAGFSGQMGFY